MPVGIVSKNIKGPLYPTVAVHSQNEEYVASICLQTVLFRIITVKNSRLKSADIMVFISLGC